MAEEVPAGGRIGSYRLERILGRGGFSVVYLATDERDGHTVALKVLAGELADDEVIRRRFLRESRLAAALDHPNVIPIHEADEADGRMYIAMRYVEGTDLRAVLAKAGRLEPDAARAILAQVAAALDAAHAAGLVHRDVKPANVLIEARSGHVYLADFGLTRSVSSASGLTATGEFMGTLDYVAPEQIQGADVDARTDVYSLGCVLYECLAGAPPFARAEEMQVLYAHLLEQPPRVSASRPDLPIEVDDVVGAALAKSKLDRLPSAGALSDAFARALTGEPAHVSGSRPTDLQTYARATAVKGPPVTRWSLPVALAIVGSIAATAIVAALRTPDDPPATTRETPPPILVRVSDDFSAQDGRWSRPSGGVRYDDGALLIDVPRPDEHVVSLWGAAGSASEVSFEAMLAVRSGSATSGLGLVCLASGDDYYELLITPAGTYAIDRARDGAFTRLATGSIPGFRAGARSWSLRADCVSDAGTATLRLWVDGRLAGGATDTDDALGAGRIGVTVVSGPSGGLAVTADDAVAGTS